MNTIFNHAAPGAISAIALAVYLGGIGQATYLMVGML